MVRTIEKATMASAELAFRPSVDGPLFNDRRCRVAGLARSRLRRRGIAAGNIRSAAYSQCCLDTALLWPTSPRPWLRRHRPGLVIHRRNHHTFLSDPLRSRATTCALSYMGDVRDRAEFRSVALKFGGGRLQAVDRAANLMTSDTRQLGVILAASAHAFIPSYQEICWKSRWRHSCPTSERARECAGSL